MASLTSRSPPSLSKEEGDGPLRAPPSRSTSNSTLSNTHQGTPGGTLQADMSSSFGGTPRKTTSSCLLFPSQSVQHNHASPQHLTLMMHTPASLACASLPASPEGTCIDAAVHDSGVRIGYGVSGTVCVLVTADGEHTARKFIPRTTDDLPSSNLRTELEIARHMRDLRSPDTLRVLGVGVRPTVAFIDMEYMDGGHAGRLAPVPEPVLAAMTRQLVAGLRVLHDELRVVHRDLKPENVLLNSAGRVKIADFGVAALLPPGVDAATDQQGTILQMSPERLRGEPHGFASDVWSLGVTVAQLATGRHPFVPAGAAAASTERFWLLAEVIRHTASTEECEAATRAAVDKALAAASPELRDFVHQCTRCDHQKRPTAAALERHRMFFTHPFVANDLTASRRTVAMHCGPLPGAPVVTVAAGDDCTPTAQGAAPTSCRTPACSVSLVATPLRM